jgi:phage portal protein BeeE
MPSSIDTEFQEAEARVKTYRASAQMALAKAGQGGSGPYSRSSGGSYGSHISLAQHAEQYRYNRGYVYAANRPVSVRVAGQSFKAGHRVSGGPSGLKACKAGTERYDRQMARHLLQFKTAPSFVSKQASKLEVLDNHDILEVLENPNDFHTEWMLKYFAAANIQITGKAFWWLEFSEYADRWMIWPLPSSWVKPDESEGLNQYGWAKWLVTPPGATQPFPVSGEDMCYFFMPDPADPTGALSPLQAAAYPVSIAEQIDNCQYQGFKNGIRPSVILKAGRKPSMPNMPAGQMERITLNATQRKQLIEAIKNAYSGWMHHGDPAIVDGIIEDIVPYDRSPQEMDYVATGMHNAARIYQGHGVNPISVGELEGANRASAYVADENLISNVVNPMLTMMSEVATKRLGPKFAKGGEKLYVWIEQARPHDADIQLRQYVFARAEGDVSGNEVRYYLDLPPRKGGDVVPFQRPQTDRQRIAWQNDPNVQDNGTKPTEKVRPGKKPVKPARGPGRKPKPKRRTAKA